MLVLLTGATGFVGGHIASQLLEAGHLVRAIVRPGRTERLRTTFPGASLDKLEAFELESLSEGDYTEALRGVDAVIHCASPAFLKGETNKEIFEGGYKGTVHIAESAVANGVKRIIVTGSNSALLSANFAEAMGDQPLGPESYGDFNLETLDPENTPAPVLYQAIKNLGDKAIWKLSEKHPDVDFSMLILPLIFGPYVENYPAYKTVADLGTVGFVYGLISPSESMPFNPFWQMMDVRDAAKAHIMALTTPASSVKKRFLLSSKKITHKEVVELIRKERPDLADRVTTAEPSMEMTAPYDLTRTEEVLGLKEYIPWEDTILASIDESLKLEKNA